MEETRKYKQTELGLLPEDWEVAKLGDVAKVKRGVRVVRSQLKEEGCFPVFQNTYIPLGYYYKSNVKAYTPFVIIGGSAGQIGISKVDYWAADDCAYLECGNTLVNLFLYYTLLSNQKTINGYVRNGTVPRLDRRLLEKIYIPFPPIQEQRRIASALTSIDNLIDSLDRLIAKKREIKQGAMQQLLSGKKRLKGFTEPWVEKKLGDVVTNSIGLTYSPNNVKKYGTLVLRSSNIKNGKLIFEDNVFVEMSIPERAKVHTNDLLVCVRNGSKALIGKSAVITEDAEGMAFGAFMTILRANGIEQIFLNYYWQTDFIQKQVRDNMGATINQITNADISDFDIYVPSYLPEQQAIASVLTSMDNELSALEAKRKKYEQIKRGMMQQLLTGRIRLN